MLILWKTLKIPFIPSVDLISRITNVICFLSISFCTCSLDYQNINNYRKNLYNLISHFVTIVYSFRLLSYNVHTKIDKVCVVILDVFL